MNKLNQRPGLGFAMLPKPPRQLKAHEILPDTEHNDTPLIIIKQCEIVAL